MDYTSHSETDIQRILTVIGIGSVDELIDKIIPKHLQLDRKLDLEDGICESRLVDEFNELANRNHPAAKGLCFLGGGAYDHYIPAAISHITGRSEFLTAYTPYQAEVAQGTLQTIYEFQTMVCRLMGMDAASASHYDGASALAEGVLLAVRKTKRSNALVPYGLNPSYLETLKTYCEPAGISIRTASYKDGLIDIEKLKEQLDGIGAVVIQQPNYFGLMEPVAEISKMAHEVGAMVVSSTYPTSLAMYQPPGEWGADIATAEGQPLGIPMSMGGPYVGFFAVRQPLVRMMPGRIVARAEDKNGNEGYVLTLQTREQHIRREKATSNICTNQALMALTTLVYLSLLGTDGLRKAASNSYRGAHYLADKIADIPGCNLRFTGNYFNEFVLQLPKPANKIVRDLADEGIFVGPTLETWFPELENCILVSVTEKRRKADIDRLVNSLARLTV